MKYFLTILTIVINIGFLTSQTRNEFSISKGGEVNFREIKNDWKTQVKNMEAPNPGGESYRSYLEKKKLEIENKYQNRGLNSTNSFIQTDTLNPQIVSTFEGHGFGGGVPNDNTLAVSNDGKVISSINSMIYVFDEDSTQLYQASLEAFGESLGNLNHKYDPKLKYDPEADRFIVTYLAGTADTATNIIVGFSQTNDPLGDWNLYSLPGNPYNNNYWSDYPALGLTNEDFFVTINLIETGVSWQEGFRGTLIWQMDKSTGYNGEALTAVMWDDIRFGGNFIRNMHPISGGSELNDEIYFLSNRNFDETNDTIFVMHLTGDANDENAELEIKYGITDQPYGVPPNGRQIGAHRLATNDARVLGGFLENNQIQFVTNSINHESGNASVYHGFITNYDSDTPNITGNILGDSTDWGYPNIAYTGRYSGDNEAIINFNFVHPQVYSSCGVIQYDGKEGAYSEKIVTRTGNIYVDIMSGTDRWGDYSGMQRKYDEPGSVWCTGTYGDFVSINGYTYKANVTQITKLMSSDTLDIEVPVSNFTFDMGPNPASDMVRIWFDLPNAANTSILIHDIQGKLVKTLIQDQMKSGSNLLSFSADPLSEGVYFVSIYAEGELIQTERLVKE